MLQRIEHHSFIGMQKDLAKSKHPAQYLYDAKNIRLTQREDGSTLLAVTNEKGTTETGISISGNYLGHGVINKYLVVFSTGATDYIERIDLSDLTKVVLYAGPLDFSTDYPIECLCSYESEIIQKVYWTDGNNPPRVINVANNANGVPYSYSDKKTPFDFVPELSLTEEVTITKQYDNGGMFPSGVIQYAFTYYNKYGQESNVFYSTELHAISFKGRAGNPEEKVSNSFKIDITGIDSTNKFDYVRVYAIMRTSEQGTPNVRRVVDLPVTDSTSLSFTDTGTTGDAVDPTVLLFIGGEEIIAQTLTAKDGTLFFGNIKINRKEISQSIQTKIQQSVNISYTNASVNLTQGDSSSFYVYYNNIDIPPFFKHGEHYRYGIQFQHKSGRWSAPVVIQLDATFNGDRPSISDGVLSYSTMLVTINNNNGVVTDLKNLDYVKARGLVVLPTLQDRLILTQGIVCPTVFNTKMRTANAPFAMSSWFARPDSPSRTSLEYYDGTDADIKNYGIFNQYKQFETLVTPDWRGEIQGSTGHMLDTKFFGVDRSIITMHSPDIEFDPNLTDTSYSGWKLRLIGRALVTKSASDIDIQTSTPAKDSNGFRKLSFTTSSVGVNAGRSLAAAPMWQDALYTKDNDGTITPGSRLFMVYPWQKQGSLGNDTKRKDGSTQTSLLLKKKMSVLRYCDIVWHNNDLHYDNINDVGLFWEDQVVLNTLNDSNGSTYFGNVDTLINMGEYPLYAAANTISNRVEALPTKVNDKKIVYSADDFVRMKYKSGKHMFMYLGTSNNHVLTLPYISDSAKPTEQQQYSVPWKTISNETDTSDIAGQAVPVFAYGHYFSGDDDNGIIADGAKPDTDKLLILNTGSLATLECYLYKISGSWTTDKSSLSPAGNDVLIETVVENIHYYAVAAYIQTPSDAYYKYTNSEKTSYYSSQIGSAELKFLYDSSYDSTGTMDNVFYDSDYYFPDDGKEGYSYYWLAELYRDSVENAFGGDTQDALKSNIWLPASKPVILDNLTNVVYRYGDTYYQRYDSLKTYAFTNEDENSIVDIVSFLCESRINADGRYDRNRGKTSNLTVSPINFNLYNPVYSQKNNFFSYTILDEDFYKNSNFPNQITWTKEKQAGADTDLWTNLTLASTYDMDGSKGIIRSLNTWKNNLYCFQDRGVSNILFNSRVQIPTSDGVPIEISNSYKVDGYRYLSDGVGCINKFTVKETPAAIYFIDSLSHNLYSIGEAFNNLTFSHNFNSWFWNNGGNINKTLYDDIHHDLYLITDDSALCYSEMLGEFTSFMDYEKLNIMESYNSDVFALKATTNSNRKLFKLFSGLYNDFFGETIEGSYIPNFKPWELTFISNGLDGGASGMDKIFGNIDYRLDFFEDTSYNPDITFDYMRAYNEYQDTQEVTLDSKNDGKGYKTSKFYPKGNPQKKFRIWRIQVPREKRYSESTDSYVITNDRIRNPWSMFTLGKRNDSVDSDLNSLRAILQDLNVEYYI